MNISVDKQQPAPLPSETEILALGQNTTLVNEFARELARSPSFLLASEVHDKAIHFLAPHSATLRRCCEVQSELRLTGDKLREIQRGLTEKLFGSTSSRGYREEVVRSLNSLKVPGSPHMPSGGADAPDLDTLWREADALLTRNQRILERFSKDLQSAVTPFTRQAENIVEHITVSDAVTGIATQLCSLSSYYPRGLSPEAEAARAGLLKVSGDSETMLHVLSLYVQSELAVAGKAAPDLPRAGYFAELTQLKKQLRASSSKEAMSQLKELYGDSGSTALAFYAALNCIEAGDTSHQTLFRAFSSAEELGSLSTLAETLRNAPNHASDRAVLLQLYRIGLVTNDSTRQDLLAELKMKHQMSAEKSFAEALECESLGRFAEAKEKAVNAWSHARKEPTSLSHLALEAMKFAYHTHFKSTHTPEENEAFSNAVATQLFKLDANDSMAWQIVCSTLLERGTPDATAWESIDKLLSVAKSPTGAYVAGTHAHKRNDIQRAWDYLSQVTGRSGQALRAKILSADLAHSEGDHEGATKLYRYVSTWAPHHPALPSFLIEGTPIRVVTPMVLAPQVLPVADWSPPTRLAISDAVLAVKSGQPPMQALSAISQYATLQDLLRYDSALFEKCHDAVRELGSHVEALSPFLNESNPSTWGLLPWSSSHLHWNDVVHIHEALNPEGHKYTFGQFANLLQNLERAAATLDPGMQHLAPLRLHERLHRAAERTRRAHGRCTELYNTSKGGDARLQSVKELVSEITQVRELLVHEITANLRRGKDTLGEWTGKLLSLPNGILLDMQEREEHRTFVDTRIRRKHLQ